MEEAEEDFDLSYLEPPPRKNVPPIPSATVDDIEFESSPPDSQAHDKKHCPFCAELIALEAIKCRFCGSMLVPTHQPSDYAQHTEKTIAPSSSSKDPLLMAVLSGCCIAGLGQVVLGQVTKGVVCLLGSIALAVGTAGLSVFIIWPLMAIDAYMVAKKLESGEAVTEWESFPS